MGWTYAFRLKLIVNSGISTGAIPSVYKILVLIFFIIPAIYIVCDILAIIAIYNNKLSKLSEGKFTQYVFGAFNIALISNDICMHFCFVYFLLKQIQNVSKKERRNIIIFSMFLCSNSFAHLAGCIYNFFYPLVGTIWLYTFWLNNVLVFLILNIMITKTLKKRKKQFSKPG